MPDASGQQLPTSDDAEPEPYRWWANGLHVSQPRSIVELLAAGTLDSSTAALLWLLLADRCSLLVAAAAGGAGKTTLLSALTDFLPPTTSRYYLRGWSETFSWAADADPATSYLFCNEISPHLPAYLWGAQVQRLFALAQQGWPFAATLHATTASEVLTTLRAAPLKLPYPALATIDLIVILAQQETAAGTLRYVTTVTLLDHASNEPSQLLTIAQWDQRRGYVVPTAAPHLAAIATRCGLTTAQCQRELTQRADWLTALMQRGVQTRLAVRQALAAYPALPLSTR